MLLKTLSEQSLSDDERYALMSLMIASVDEALQCDMNNKNNKANLSSLDSLLLQRPGLYASAILYWAEPALLELDKEEQFPISGHMALIWKQILPNLVPNPAD